jgi:hypothetical protein
MSGHTPWREIKHKRNEPKQTTDKGLEIPVPKRSEVMDAFRKIVGTPAKKQP